MRMFILSLEKLVFLTIRIFIFRMLRSYAATLTYASPKVLCAAHVQLSLTIITQFRILIFEKHT
jgi:hypothetical protein